ncbi:SurA N-terminal domain-containing protein [Rhodopseudomonas pseudopalustris]|uniref:Periplasmic chaperone for outer membrane proteins SurA n=1 Tax=Rhodopseudomonas pseudopalustris TaxID=1513892 RepID=A0A1H8WGN7_9BRAD|nr:peptidylprolyl isomerase [Rhodopseudomonas pseudopalustris]SEP26587.1 periplasmic chaperone for outer membrane proteins SurA [Rhodopseudomonas pseudopalustris]
MTTKFLFRILGLALFCAVAVGGGLGVATAQSVAVMVNGEPITNFDIEQRSKLDRLSRASRTRQQVLDELIDEKVKIREGKKYGVSPSDSDIESSFSTMSSRMRMSPDQMTKMLSAQGIRPETLKSKIKAEMVWASLVRGRFKDSLLVGEKDIQAQLGAKGGDEPATTESFEYQLRPVVLIVSRGSDSSALEARRKEAESLRSRVQSCADADRIFKALPNTAIRSTVVKTSADLPQALREILDKTPVGQMTAPEATKQGIEMVALCSRKPTTADTPKKREIRDKLFAEKFQAKSKEYLREVRNAAMIEVR